MGVKIIVEGPNRIGSKKEMQYALQISGKKPMATGVIVAHKTNYDFCAKLYQTSCLPTHDGPDVGLVYTDDPVLYLVTFPVEHIPLLTAKFLNDQQFPVYTCFVISRCTKRCDNMI